MSDWRQRGACVEIGPEPWFLGVGGDPTPAKQMCAGCPVIEQCREFAMTAGIEHGTYGGLTAPERKQLGRSTYRSPLCENGHFRDTHERLDHRGSRVCRACERMETNA